MAFIKPTVLASNDRLVDMTREKYMGVTAMQFRVNDQGELVREVKFPLPTRADRLFQGRSPVSDDYRRAYEAEQSKSVEDSAAPPTSGPVTDTDSALPEREAPAASRPEEE